MKYLAMLTICLLMTMRFAQAEISLIGTIDKIDLGYSTIVINKHQYRVKHGKTKVYTGEHLMEFGFLQQGTKVKYISDDNLITEIRLITPSKFKE